MSLRRDSSFDVFTLSKRERVVFEAIKRVDCASRGELPHKCALPRTSSYDTLIRLEQCGLGQLNWENHPTRGRPTIFYELKNWLLNDPLQGNLSREAVSR